MLLFSTVADAPNCTGLKKLYIGSLCARGKGLYHPSKDISWDRASKPDFLKGAHVLCVPSRAQATCLPGRMWDQLADSACRRARIQRQTGVYMQNSVRVGMCGCGGLVTAPWRIVTARFYLVSYRTPQRRRGRIDKDFWLGSFPSLLPVVHRRRSRRGTNFGVYNINGLFYIISRRSSVLSDYLTPFGNYREFPKEVATLRGGRHSGNTGEVRKVHICSILS